METISLINKILYISPCESNMQCDTYNSTATSSSTISSTLSYTTNSTLPCCKPKPTVVPSPSLSPKKSSLSSKYKGVIAQSSGHWGAQFYEGTKRVWLGTFESQELAAQAYDTAVIRCRGPLSTTNFSIKYYNRTFYLEFVGALSKQRIIEMLRTHTFSDEFSRFQQARIAINPRKREGHDYSTLDQDLSRKELFKKVVTASDAGKLHRLVIPKRHAKRYFPDLCGEDARGVMLSFEDGKLGKLWRFKYNYWNSCQNYVLTKGWGEFVKEKCLKPGDIVTFHSSSGSGSKVMYIDATARRYVKQASDSGNGRDALRFVRSQKILRLFGVDICPIITESSTSSWNDNENCSSCQLDDREVVSLDYTK